MSGVARFCAFVVVFVLAFVIGAEHMAGYIDQQEAQAKAIEKAQQAQAQAIEKARQECKR